MRESYSDGSTSRKKARDIYIPTLFCFSIDDE